MMKAVQLRRARRRVGQVPNDATAYAPSRQGAVRQRRGDVRDAGEKGTHDAWVDGLGGPWARTVRAATSASSARRTRRRSAPPTRARPGTGSRAEAPLRPRQPLPAQPQHPASELSSGRVDPPTTPPPPLPSSGPGRTASGSKASRRSTISEISASCVRISSAAIVGGGFGQGRLARVVERDGLGERDLEAEVARAATEFRRAMCGSSGRLRRVWAQWSAPSAAPPSVAPDRQTAVLRKDPSELAPLADLVLAIAVLVEAGPIETTSRSSWSR